MKMYSRSFRVHHPILIDLMNSWHCLQPSRNLTLLVLQLQIIAIMCSIVESPSVVSGSLGQEGQTATVSTVAIIIGLPYLPPPIVTVSLMRLIAACTKALAIIAGDCAGGIHCRSLWVWSKQDIV